MAALSRAICLLFSFFTLLCYGINIKRGPTTLLYQRIPAWQHNSLGYSAFAHHYLRNHSYFLFLGLIRCFSSPRYLPQTYIFSKRILIKSRLSHSEICGSKGICPSPQLIAAYHVLHRQLVPRHPSYTLYILIYSLNFDEIFLCTSSAIS